MKILSIAVPVYNTEKYLRRCVDSMLVEGILQDIEIILVNDGSKDGSINIMNEYKNKYPETVVVIDKENGGHGSTINAALKVATGKYFRVLDSDDWFDSYNFEIFINKLKDEDADLVITNYRKEFIYSGASVEVNWQSLEEDKLYDFNTFDLNVLDKEYFVMANSTYKLEVLKKSKLELMEKTFYVDMQYNVMPIICLKNFKFWKLDIYRYFIGRPEQSMNLQNFVKNRKNHEKVMRFLIEYYMENKDKYSDNQREYVKQILYYMLTTHYYIYCVYAEKDKKQMYNEIKEWDKYLKQRDQELYTMMNDIGQIRFNRKTKFIGVRISSKNTSKIVTTLGRLKR